MKNKETIKAEIINYNKTYRIGKPSIEDSVYDGMLDELQNMIDPQEYIEFRTSLMENKGKIKHPYIMGSLEKVKYDADDNSLDKWIKDIKPTVLIATPKVDGLSVRLEYDKGILVNAVTRGDGEYGEDILNKVVHFCRNKLNQDFTGNIRGEIVLTNENFLKLCEMHNKEYKNPRNSAVGLINSKDVDVDAVKLLNIYTYEIIGSDTTKQFQLTTLNRLGLNTVDITSNIYITEFIKESLLNVYNNFKETSPFDIDGVVISDQHLSIFENKKLPSYTVAFKANSLNGKTSILDIEYNVSKNGYLIPVALLDPIELGGSMIGRCKLDNYQAVKNNKVKYNMEVSVLKSGDIIPVITNFNQNSGGKLIEFPEDCPDCGTKLVEEGVELRCPNKYCKAQTVQQVEKFIEDMGVENVKRQGLENFGIFTFTDLMNWKPDIVYRSQKKFYDELCTKVFKANKRKLFCSLDFNGVGQRILDKLIDAFGFDNVLAKNIDRSNLPFGVGDKIIDNFLYELDDNLCIINLITNDSRYNNSEVCDRVIVKGVLTDKSFCFTGKLNTMTREDAEEMVKQNGGSITGVSKNLTYLVTNDSDSNSSKMKKARAYGTKVISEQMFLDMVKTVENNDVNSL